MSDLERARAILDSDGPVVVLTGAGISAESGIPTFRGSDGLWKNYRPEELATPEAFERDPQTVWEWYAMRREIVAACKPNEAHTRLARAAVVREHFRIVTQNVDGLHGLAASRALATEPDPTGDPRPLELHGSLFVVRCTACGEEYEDRESCPVSGVLPACRACGGPLRPGVVWFGEALPVDVLKEAAGLAARARVCLVVGTSAVVHPAAGLAIETIRAGGAIIEVNPEPTPLTEYAVVSIRAGACEAVGTILP